MLRTPCASYFSPGADDNSNLFEDLTDMITEFGQRQLGMNAVTPPWMSCYVDGHEQRLHTDSTHGPWAFVLSLTPDDCVTALEDGGGDTLIMNPSVLDYWRGYDGFAREEGDLFQSVRPQMGRIIAFDPRLPHGVRQVRGPRHMSRGRLVIHGWFSEPTPFFYGGLAVSNNPEEGGEALEEAAASVLDGALSVAMGSISSLGRLTGCLSARVTVCGKTGKVTGVDALCDTLVVDPDDFQGIIGYTENDEPITEDARADVLLALHGALSSAKFPVPLSGTNDTEITVPFIFE